MPSESTAATDVDSDDEVTLLPLARRLPVPLSFDGAPAARPPLPKSMSMPAVSTTAAAAKASSLLFDFTAARSVLKAPQAESAGAGHV